MKISEKIIEDCKRIILSPEYKKYIKALYIGGSFRKEDRTEESDLDLIGIVYDNFQPVFEGGINIILAEKIKIMKCKLRVLYLSELRGGFKKSFITYLLPVKLFIRRIPHFPVIWGAPLDIADTIGPYSLKEEMQVQSSLIRDYIERLNSDYNQIPFEWIPKAVLYLSAIELMFRKQAEYTVSFSETVDKWKDETNHISHASMRIRKAGYLISKNERNGYLKAVTKYLDQMKSLSDDD